VYAETGETVSDLCPTDEQLAQIADGRLDDAATASHVSGCERCTSTIHELRRVTSLLTALGRAESRAPVAPLWTAIESQLITPSWRQRVPLALLDGSRLVGAFTQPRVAAAWTMCIAGIASGVWLARVDGNGSSTLSYAESSLADETAAGLADLYAESFDDGASAEDAFGDDPASPPDDSTDAHDD
jgi:hypothetical protein